MKTTIWLISISLATFTVPAFAETTAVDTFSKATAGNEVILQLMEDARQAMMEHEYGRAIKFYQQLVDMPDHVFRRDAIESLGLAYERAGDLKKAKKTYEYYLQLYPKSEGVERIRQRIAGVVTASWEEKKKLKTTKTKPRKSQWRNYGSWSQYLRRNATIYENENEVVNINALSSNLDANSRGKIGSLDIKARFTGSHNADLEDESNDYKTLSYLYAEINNRAIGIYSRIGRQRPKGGGVLSRFDGINFGYHLTSSYIINFLAGMPVDRTKNTHIDESKKFYGINLETGPWNKYWLANAYFIRQLSESFIDREATGGELRYVHPKRSLYSFIDYDLHFDKLNIFSTQASLTLNDKITYNLYLDYRHSPALTTRSALLSQSVQSLEELNKTYTEDEIHQLAIDRSAEYYMAMASIAYKFNQRYRLDTDFTAVNQVATPASGGVPATPGTPNEYYFSTRLTISNIFSKQDINIIGLRYSDTSYSTQKQLFLNTRFNMNKKWSINPSLMIDDRRYTSISQKASTEVKPGIRTDYRPSRKLSFELEVLPEWTERIDSQGKYEYKNYYVNAGYRYLFN